MGKIPTRIKALGADGRNDQYKGLKFTANTAGSTIKLQKSGSAPTVYLTVSYNEGQTWSSYTVGNVLTMTNAGDTICFKAASGRTNRFASGTSSYHRFVVTGSINASGNIMSLVSESMPSAFSSTYNFTYLFNNCTQLIDAS